MTRTLPATIQGVNGELPDILDDGFYWVGCIGQNRIHVATDDDRGYWAFDAICGGIDSHAEIHPYSSGLRTVCPKCRRKYRAGGDS